MGRWILERMKVYHPFTGVTNNQSESFNATLKRLQRWREVPVDTIVLTLYHVQAYYFNEIQRGLAGKFTANRWNALTYTYRVGKLSPPFSP